MARRRRQKEPEPIPPPTHIAQTYDEILRTRGRVAPFGIGQDVGSLRRDPNVLAFMTTEEQLLDELKVSEKSFEKNLKKKIEKKFWKKKRKES